MATIHDTTLTDSRAARPPAAGSGLVLAADRPPGIVAFESSLVAFFVEAAELLGVPRSVAAIYGIVFASPVPLSFADIAARLDISNGSVSQGLRVLREVGALKEVSSAKDRTELFEPDLEMRQLVGHYLKSRLEQQLTAGKSRLKVLQQGVSVYPTGEQKPLRKRLTKLQRWNDRARALVPMVRTFLELT